MSLYSTLGGVGDTLKSKFGDAAGDTKDNILDGLGGVAKGYFLIPSLRSGKKKTEEQLTKALQKAQTDILKKAEKRLQSNISNTSSKTSSSSEDYSGSDFFTYEVQYNPSTLTIKTMSGTHRQKVPGMAGETAYEDVDLPTFTDLTVTLIFEAINNHDAFITGTDGFSLNIGDTISGISNAANKVSDAMSLASGGSDSDKYSVRRNVQGFLALMTRTGWRNISFFYGRTCFHGVLTSVNPTYKMFNKSGEPILAEVQLTIRQDTSSDIDNGIWLKSFEEVVDYQP